MSESAEDLPEDDGVKQAPEANDNSPNAEDTERALDRAYSILPKILAQITSDNAARYAALDRLLSTFEKINKLESAPGRMNLTQIYEMAASGNGGGSEEMLAELQAANAAFSEENTILVQTIESLGFQIKALREAKIDEKIENGELKKDSAKEFEKSLSALKTGLEQVLQYNITTQKAEESSKAFEEQLLQQITGLDAISGDMLAASPDNKSIVGRLLRKNGYAFDYKDLVAVRAFMKAVIKLNGEQSQIIRDIQPLREHLEKIHEHLELLTTVQANDIRQSKEYQEALAEIRNIRGLKDNIEKKYGTLKEIEEKIQIKQNRLQSMTSQEVDMQRRVGIAQKELAELREAIRKETPKAEPNQQDTKQQAQDASERLKLAQRIQQLEQSITKLNTENKQLQTQINERDQRIRNMMQSASDENRQRMANAEISRLRAENMELQRQMLDSESALTIQQLSLELEDLKREIKKSEDAVLEEKQQRVAMEERIVTWVKTEDQQKEHVDGLTAERDKWKGRARWRWAALGGASVIGLGVGYSLNSYLLANGGSYFAATALALLPGVLGLIGGIGGGILDGISERRGMLGTAFRMVAYGGIGAVGGAFLGLSAFSLMGAGFEAHNSYLLKQCYENGCAVEKTVDDDGDITYTIVQQGTLGSTPLPRAAEQPAPTAN